MKDNEKRHKKGETNNPEQLPDQERSQLDEDVSEMNVDPIPLEDLKEEQKEEKQKPKSKDDSASQKKYREG
ncbi:hypothetical protein [Alkalihalobacillus sp. CinArs1]|uniref:hypothetical protein n=1 Tax=Alkalihalobacillus sp. CinArs1 TaxID=2995314 RepID=UPI0022DD4FC8|nr:hypothetical protein [Alkalihalobacillus sp. CinArs1]